MAKKRETSFKYCPTKEELEAMSLCNENGLYIHPLPQDNVGHRIKMHVIGDGYDQTGTEEYNGLKDVWYKAVFYRYVKLKDKENYVKEKN